MSDPLVTLADMHSLGYCNRIARVWLKRYGLSWYQLRNEGLPASVLEATGDAQAIRLCEEVRRRGR